MGNVSTVVLATDFSERSKIALDYCIWLASTCKAQLVIAHVFHLSYDAQNIEFLDHRPSYARVEAREQLNEFVTRASQSGCSVAGKLVEGVFPENLLDLMKEIECDLLVVSTRKTVSGVGSLFLGPSRTEILMMNSLCPTFTLGPRVQAAKSLDETIDTVVYISNLRRGSESAAPLVARFGATIGRPIAMFQVVRNCDPKRPGMQVTRAVEEYCARLKALGVNVPQEWCDPVSQLGKLITPQDVLDKSADSSILLAVGVHNAPLLGRHLHVSYPYRLLETAACPVISFQTSVIERDVVAAQDKVTPIGV